MRNVLAFLFATLRAIQGFLDLHKDLLAEVNASRARKNLDALVQQLSTQSVDQHSGRTAARGETALQVALRNDLRLYHMKPIAIVAQARLRAVPEMKAFVFPRATTSSPRLVESARGMADAAAKHTAEFIEGGLSEDFIARLVAATDALSQSVDNRAKSDGRSIGATTALAGLEKPARAAIRVLDALVLPFIVNDDRLMGEWRAARRIHRKTGPASGSPAGGATPTPVVTPVATSAETAA